MHMLLMLGILTVIYFITLFIMCLYRAKINFKIYNRVFIILNLIAFFAWNYATYLNGGLKDGWITLDNISPFTFTVILLTPFMKESVRTYAYSTISFLSVGMFFAMLISPEHAYLFNFDQEATFYLTSEAICHLICSLYGFFLVLCNKVKADFNHWIKSIIFLYSFIVLGIALNYIYHKDFFGMDPYGNYRIYMINIFDSFGATLFAYLAGVMVVLTLGLHAARLIERGTSDRNVRTHEENDAHTVYISEKDDTDTTAENKGVKNEQNAAENEAADIKN